MSDPLSVGAFIWHHSFDGSWWLGKIKQPLNDCGRYVIRFLDTPGPALTALPRLAYNTALHAPCGSWCLQTHGRSNPLQGVLHGLTCPMVICRPQENCVYSPTPMSTSKLLTSTPRIAISTPRTAVSTPRTLFNPLLQGTKIFCLPQ